MPFDLGDHVRVWGGNREGSVGKVCGVSGDGVSSVHVYFPEDKKREWMECGTHQVIKINKPGVGELGTSECVSEVKVSSQLDSDHGADKLTDGDDETFWRTVPGTPPHHWVKVYMKQDIAVHHISVMIGGCKIDALPHEIELWGGDQVDDMALLRTVNNISEDKKDGKHWVDLLDDTVEVALEQRRFNIWEVRVTEMHVGDDDDEKGCVVNGLKVTGDNTRHVPPPTPPHTTADTVHELSNTMKTVQNESNKEIKENFHKLFQALENKVSDNEKSMESKVSSIEKSMESRVTNVERAMESRVTNVEKSMESRVTNVEKAMESRVTNVEKSMESRVTNVEKAEDEIVEVVKDKMTHIDDRMQAFDHRIERVEDKEMSILEDMSSKLNERLVALEGRQSESDEGLTAVGQQVADIGNKIQQDINTGLEASEVKLEGMLSTRIEDLVSKMGEEQEKLEGKITELEKKQLEESERQLAAQNRNNDILDVCRLNAGSFLKLEWQRGRDCSEGVYRHTLCDVIIQGEEEGDSEPIRAHSNVICTRATGFLDFLTRVGRMQTQTDSDRPTNLLYITDFYPPDSVTADKSAVKYVIDFCYNKPTGPLNLDIVENVYKVSEMIGVEDLKQACSDLLQDNISADNYVKLYHTALNLPSDLLKANVDKFVLHNLKDCLKSPSVIHLSLESFLHLFSMDNLCNLDPVDDVVLYEAIIRWVKAESFDEEIRARSEERLKYLVKLMYFVKFANINKEFLANQVENEHVISSNEEMVNKIYEFLPGRRRSAKK